MLSWLSALLSAGKVYFLYCSKFMQCLQALWRQARHILLLEHRCLCTAGTVACKHCCCLQARYSVKGCTAHVLCLPMPGLFPASQIFADAYKSGLGSCASKATSASG